MSRGIISKEFQLLCQLSSRIISQNLRIMYRICPCPGIANFAVAILLCSSWHVLKASLSSSSFGLYEKIKTKEWKKNENSQAPKILATRHCIIITLLANFHCQYVDRHMRIYNLWNALTRKSGQFDNLLSWQNKLKLVFMHLSSYWQWIPS